MPLQYNKEDASPVWPEGDYDATLTSVMDRTFKSGNSGQEWTITVYDASGKQMTILDRVVVPGATFKIKQLAIALNRGQEFDNESFQPDDYVGENFVVTLKVESGGEFPDKNAVKKYKPKPSPAPRAVSNGRSTAAEKILNSTPSPRQQVAATHAAMDENIPF
jgi:hypothetical protein